MMVDNEHCIDPVSDLEIRSVDEHYDTYITIGCYRETSRLDRMLKVYQRAMTLAHGEEMHTVFNGSIRSLYDCHGNLNVVWRHKADFLNFRRYIEKAWSECCEIMIRHEDRDGKMLAELQLLSEYVDLLGFNNAERDRI